jgi:hypothetical protein
VPEKQAKTAFPADRWGKGNPATHTIVSIIALSNVEHWIDAQRALAIKAYYRPVEIL